MEGTSRLALGEEEPVTEQTPPCEEATAEDTAPEENTAPEEDTAAEESPMQEDDSEVTTVSYEALEEEDLRTLRGDFPELADTVSLSALSDPVRYGELRELGLSPREAYLATEGRRTVRQRDTRSHLGSSVGRTASPAGGRLGAAELYAARDLFPSLSDGEIEALFRRVTRQRHHQ